jgi:hypothetical protein
MSPESYPYPSDDLYPGTDLYPAPGGVYRTFGQRLFDELSQVESGPDFFTFCDGIGAMFEEVEMISSDAPGGHPGFSILLDINRIPIEWLPYLAQFIGATVNTNLASQDQRNWVKSATGLVRSRPAAIKAAVQTTLTGDQFVHIRERDGSAWRYTVVTKPEETPDAAATMAVIQATKPAPDQAFQEIVDYADYEWVKENIATYADLRTAYATYGDLAGQEIT